VVVLPSFRPRFLSIDVFNGYGVIFKFNGSNLGVEVLNIEGNQATVRALPVVIDGRKLEPQFPFEGRKVVITVPKRYLCHYKVFPNGK
jgi:hypothetical protein